MKSSLTLWIKHDYQLRTERVKVGKLIFLLQITAKTTLALWLKLSVTTQNSYPDLLKV